MAALWSTVFTYFDGQARVFEECCVRLRRAWDSAGTRRLVYRGFQVLWLVAGMAIIFGMPEPIFVVQLASLLALLFAPVIFLLDIKSIKDNFTTDFEKAFLSSKLMFAWAWLGVIALAGISIFALVMGDFWMS